MEWQPIETAPKDGTWILAYGKGMSICDYPATLFWDDGWLTNGHTLHKFEPTHWMPMPPAPDPQ